MNGEFAWKMGDVLELYAEAYDPARPAVRFDEAGKELRGHAAEPTPAEPGRAAREDYEDTRGGRRTCSSRSSRRPAAAG